ncbi:GNAT family N-acetyltransferase [Klebsiella oxytoca]|uniref:GNAT family N-acetyltransferase n=1 Tax=Klebsiella oxytoca TaxID=571 RepID=UPI0018AB5191|nr:GNAT family N-acetyltransferase [Klebsiella oxytoca]MBF8468856.1 GNAT family N-acetyltransferase [Klebsiella oxytoca]MBZ7702251.1 GNAT family N-acetyltransferase [Klebsiella oxytoca]
MTISLPHYQLEISDCMTDDQLLPIEAGLNGFNDQITSISDRKPLSVIVRCQETGKVLGGMQGRTSLGLLFIDLFYLPPALRNNGLGTTILAQFENEGRKRGCIAGFLYTITFQAPDFYKKHGWEEFGRIDCLPEGTSRIFMKKSFS